MPLGFLQRGSIFGANAVGLLQVGSFVGMIFILTNYLQQVRGYSALSTGLGFIPMGIVFLLVSAFLSARLVNHLFNKSLDSLYNKSLEVEIEALQWVQGQLQHLVVNNERKDTKVRI